MPSQDVPNPCLHMYRLCLKAEIHSTDLKQHPKKI